MKKYLRFLNPWFYGYKVVCFAGNRFMRFYLGLDPISENANYAMIVAGVALFLSAIAINQIP